MGEVLACANQKGGVGKTTTVVNLAAYLALEQRRVLVIDLDPQGNATSGLGFDRHPAGSSVYPSLIDSVPLSTFVQPTAIERLFLVPSGRDLAGAEVELVSLGRRERRLESALAATVDAFDYVLLDCPPAVGLLTVSALTAADGVLAPLQCEYYALEGLSQLLATIDLVRENLNPRLHLAGVLLTMHDARTTLSADVEAEVRRHLGRTVFETVIPRSVRLAEAPSHGLPVALHSPDSRGAKAYRALALELIERTEGPMRPLGQIPVAAGLLA